MAQESDILVTPTSVALSLSPPRAPPHDSAHRLLLAGLDPSQSEWLARHHDDADDNPYVEHGIASRVQHLLDAAHLHLPKSSRMPHPHLPAGPEVADQMTRALGATLPITWQNQFRDSGSFRSLADTLVTISIPSLAIAHPLAVKKFVRLSRQLVRIQYGRHEMQGIDLFVPGKDGEKSNSTRGLVFFVHGGAWGSGLPWMYRLVVIPFLDANLAVAVVGYRTYPDADAQDQVDDLERAASELCREWPDLVRRQPTADWLGTTLIGHSSGAHIAFLMLAERAERKTAATFASQGIEIAHGDEHKNSRVQKDSSEGQPFALVPTPELSFHAFIGLSGPYDVSHHFDYEAGRGVEEISPLKPACGHSRLAFHRCSPASRLMNLLSSCEESEFFSISHLLPKRMLLVHGIEDSTVPFTATSEAGRILRLCGVLCEEFYVAQTGHQETVMHLMLGGRTSDGVMRWLLSGATHEKSIRQVINNSKL